MPTPPIFGGFSNTAAIGGANPRAAPPGARVCAVGARRDGSGWTVELLQSGASVAQISAEEARMLARELSDMADVIEGRWT